MFTGAYSLWLSGSTTGDFDSSALWSKSFALRAPLLWFLGTEDYLLAGGGLVAC